VVFSPGKGLGGNIKRALRATTLGGRRGLIRGRRDNGGALARLNAFKSQRNEDLEGSRTGGPRAVEHQQGLPNAAYVFFKIGVKRGKVVRSEKSVEHVYSRMREGGGGIRASFRPQRLEAT